MSTYQKPILTENTQIGSVTIVTYSFIYHILKLAPLLLIYLNLLHATEVNYHMNTNSQ